MIEHHNAPQNCLYSGALVLLGFCYEHGYGIEKDEKIAFNCYKKAFDQKDSYAQYKCYESYNGGKGVQQDLDIAF